MTRARLPCSLHFPDQSLRTKVSIIQNIFFSRSHEFTNSGIDGREFSVGGLPGCRSPLTESTRTALGLRILKCKLMENTKKSRPTQNTPRNPQQPGDRDHLEMARDETRPTRQSILARFHRSRVCGNRPRTALAISTNDECYTHTDRQTD